MPWKFRHVAGPFAFTEGPTWDGTGVLFSDIPTSRILRYAPDTGETELFCTNTREANGLKIGPDGALYACQGPPGKRIVRYEDGTETPVIETYDGEPFNSPNDLGFDDAGRLWFTDPRYGDYDDLPQDSQAVYRADPRSNDSWEVTRVVSDTTKPNGILVSPDGETLYVAQTDGAPDAPMELRAYPIENGTLGAYRVLFDFGPHRGIDGMCLDADGNVIATAGSDESGPGPMLYVIAPSGRVLETHPFPGSFPTNCTFGGPDHRTLFVTGDGALYAATTDRQGYRTDPPNPRTS